MTLFARSLAVLALVFSTLLLSGGDASANHSWGGYHWARTANPFTLKVGDNLTTSAWKARLTQTSTEWNAAGAFSWASGASGNASNNPLRTTVVPGTSSGKCRPVAGTTQVCNGSYGNNGWLGLASIWLQSGTTHITQGTVKVNDSYFNISTYNTVNEREHVMCQEVGHTFGLDHQSTDGSSLNTCMDYFSNTGSNAGSLLSTSPNQHDYDELATIYSHLDSSTTLGARAQSAPAAAPGLDEDGTPRGASPEKGNWYVIEDGRGGRLLVHVYWAAR